MDQLNLEEVPYEKMKSGHQGDVIYKEVVVIGNGPSGIALSFLLSGNVPYITSSAHPDEMLSARLAPLVGRCLLHQDLEALAAGLEGRTTNQISLLLDALLHPGADVGLELKPLVEFRKTGNKIDHVVVGKGPPGGSWHRMDPQILTLSLGSWMSLPGLPFPVKNALEKRAFARDVANYYVRYTERMDLKKNFRNNALVTAVESLDTENKLPTTYKNKRNNNWVRKINKEIKESVEVCIESDIADESRSCFISNAINCLMLRNRRKPRCKRYKDPDGNNDQNRKKRSISFCCDSSNVCDKYKTLNDNNPRNNRSNLRNSCSLDYSTVPYSIAYHNPDANWIVDVEDTETGEKMCYSCKYLVLANGGYDFPNRLEVSKDRQDPSWLVYDLRSLENELEARLKGSHGDLDPVLVVGAGLSAADAVIAARAKNVPVVHVFRNKSPELNKQLPENLYPEYHKVHQMMIDTAATYPLYTAYPEYNLTELDDGSRTVILTSNEGSRVVLKVSYAVVLVGSRPDLSFLPQEFNLGQRKNLPVDCKTNTVEIDSKSHSVNGCENLFVIGPLAGDNFVRFLPGGALAVVSELYRRNCYS